MSVDKKTILFKDVSETFEDKLIRIIFIKLLQKLFGSREMCDLIRKFQSVKFARDTRCSFCHDNHLKFKVKLQLKVLLRRKFRNFFSGFSYVNFLFRP